ERSGTMYDPHVVARFIDSHATGAPMAETPATPAVFSAIINTAQSDAARRRTDIALPVERAAMGAMCDLGLAIAGSSDSLGDAVHNVLGQIMPATCTVIYVYD